MGSDSDLKTLKPAIDILREFGIKTEVCILSAHRTPIEMMEYAKNAESENIKVIIAGKVGINTIIIFKLTFSIKENPLAKGIYNLTAYSGYKKLIISYS